MANQIVASNSSGLIRRGGGIVRAAKNSQIGGVSMDVAEQTKPLLADIQSKYNDNFDDPSYYYGGTGGGGGTDGGDIGDVLGV